MSRAQLRKIESALEQSKERNPKGTDPRLHRAMLEGLESQIKELTKEIANYEHLKTQKIRTLYMRSLEDLPLVLMKVRVAQGLTQAELAQILELKPQQIQRNESTGYQSVSFHRLVEIADVLGVEIRENIKLREMGSQQRGGQG